MNKPRFEPKQEVLVVCIIKECIIRSDGFIEYLVQPKHFPLQNPMMRVEESNVFLEDKLVGGD
jgi:hypothetical protein